MLLKLLLRELKFTATMYEIQEERL